MQSRESSRIRVVLVDDQSLIRQGLRAMLELEADLEIVGDADNGKTALELVAQLQPDVVLMDVRMPEMSGQMATQFITQNFPAVKVLILSTFDDETYVAGAMQAGARGYLLKDMPSRELAVAIRFVYQGYTQFGPGLFNKLSIAASDDCSKVAPIIPDLTPREQEVLRLIGQGATNREIAQQLYITEGTVKTHVTSILNRLNLRNRSQIAIYANSVFHSESLNNPTESGSK